MGGRWEWTLFRGWAFVKFLGFQGGHLSVFKVDAYSTVGAYSNEYGI